MSCWDPSAALSCSCLLIYEGEPILIWCRWACRCVIHHRIHKHKPGKENFHLFWRTVSFIIFFSSKNNDGRKSCPVLISCKTEIPHQRQSRNLHKVYWGVCKRKCSLQGSAWRCEPDAMFRRWRQHELFTAAAAGRRAGTSPVSPAVLSRAAFFGAGNVSFTTRVQLQVLAPRWHSATCWSGTGRSSHPVSAALMVVNERWCSLSLVGGSVNIKMCSLAIFKGGKKNRL